MPYHPKFFQWILLNNKYNLFILITSSFEYKPCFVAPLFTTPMCFGMRDKCKISCSSRKVRARRKAPVIAVTVYPHRIIGQRSRNFRQVEILTPQKKFLHIFYLKCFIISTFLLNIFFYKALEMLINDNNYIFHRLQVDLKILPWQISL